jgi:hypothetical protein
MKAFAIVALWAFLGFDLGAWGEALVGIPAVVGLAAGVALGAWLAIETRRRMPAAGAAASQVSAPLSMDATPLDLDRAA